MQAAQAGDAMADKADGKRHWSWPQFAMAVGLLPVALLMWAIGLESVFAPRSDRLLGSLFVLSPLVAVSGVVWILVLVVRRFRTR
jgi:hypothetical protein